LKYSSSIADVVSYGVVKEDVLLGHHGDLAAQRAQLGFPDIAAINANSAGSDIIKSGQEIDERGLARAACADEGN